MQVSLFGRILIGAAGLLGIWIFLHSLFTAGVDAILLAPFLVIGWMLFRRVVIAVFGTEEAALPAGSAHPKPESKTVPVPEPKGHRAPKPEAARPTPRPVVAASRSRAPEVTENERRGLSELEAATAGAVGAWLALRPEEDTPEPPEELDPEDDFGCIPEDEPEDEDFTDIQDEQEDEPDDWFE